MSPYVNFPDAYSGNKSLQYSVSLGNAWRNDPEVVPEPEDASSETGISVNKDCRISWSDNTFTDIVLNPADVSKSAPSGGKAIATWQWVVNPGEPKPPFTLKFDAIVPGCQIKTDSNGGAITLRQRK